MQCTNCGFQNMPGSEVCGRCATSLGLATAVMDVHPPRASSTTKYFRRLFPVQRAYYATRDALHADDVAARARHATAVLPPFPVFSRLIIPGWSHIFLKQRVRGHLFFWGFVACLIPTFLLFGSTWGSIWLGLAFSVHSSAALDIVNQSFTDAGTRDRIGRSIIVSILLWVCLYWPVGWLISDFARPHTVQMDLTPFAEGDVVLVNRWKTPQRGDVVLYEINNYTPVYRRGENRRTVYTGENIDRILAGPGDEVQFKSGILLVNGAPSPWQPLNNRPLPDKYSWMVPPGCYVIFPSGAPGVNLQDTDFLQNMGNVPLGNIVGRAYMQTYPLSRIHLIR